LIGVTGAPRNGAYPMNADAATRSTAARAMLWWILWAGMTAGLVAIDYAMRQVPETVPAARSVGMDALALADLLVSVLARWWMLPRVRRVQSAFVLFGVGLALAEAGGLFGVFAGAHRNALVVLGMAGLLQWMPLFARRFAAPAPGRPPAATA